MQQIRIQIQNIMQLHLIHTERYKIGQMVEQLKRWHAGIL
jgi:hypothetical protein